MRLQLADGRPYRKQSLGDASAIIGQAFEAIKKAASNPNVQKAAGQVIGGLVKKKQPVIQSSGGMQTVMKTVPAEPTFDLSLIANQLTGAQTKIEDLQKQNEALKTQRLYYGAIGLGIGIAGAMILNRGNRPMGF